MSDDRVRDAHHACTARYRRADELAMQEWFVGERAEPPVRRRSGSTGAERARPAPGVLEALRRRRHDRDLPVATR